MPTRKNKTSPVKKEEDEKQDKATVKFRSAFPKVRIPEGGLPFSKVKISHISSDKLGDLIAQYSAWREYCEDCHISAVSEYTVAKAAYDEMMGREMVLISAGDVTTKKAMAQQADSVKPLSKTLLEKELYWKMISNKLESFTNTLTILSRELTRRGIINV